MACVTIYITEISCYFVCWKSKIYTTNRTTGNGVAIDAINIAPGTPRPRGAMSTKLTWRRRELRGLSLFIGFGELLKGCWQHSE